MSVKENNTPPKAIGTHAYIQQVTRCRGISTSTKVVLTYLLEKYQTKRDDGRPWDFSNASIQEGTGIRERTVRYVMQILIKSKVLRHYGQVKVRTRPMQLYLFVPEALNDYLKQDTAKSEILILDNANAVEANSETIPKDGDTAKDTARDTAKTPDHKKSTRRKKKKVLVQAKPLK
jgi:hypothetical protein